MFAREMRWDPIEVVAISPEPGAVIALRGEYKVFASKRFGKATDSAFRIYFGMLIYGQSVVY